jgi:PRTRC genetic system ThiF family protein
MQIEHCLSADLLRRPVRVLVVGSGGNGSAILLGLPYLHQAMLVWGHPGGLDMTVMDADTVSETNCVRQPFSRSDVGLKKATVLVNRLNMFWGLGWKARPSAFETDSLRGIDERADLVIGCVDSRTARKTIELAVTSQVSVRYWLDLGNNAASGQYVLGQPLNGINRRRAERLRTVAELYPEIADPSAGEDPLPSCSAAEALERQEPFINHTLAASALAMVARLFRYGRISYHGAFFNAESGRMSGLAVDPARWKRSRSRRYTEGRAVMKEI